MNSATVLVFAAFLCCASALQEILFPGLREIAKNGGIRRQLQNRGLHKRYTTEEKCDILMDAMQDLVSSVQSAGTPAEVASFRQSILDSTGIDINDQAHLRQSVCQVASINSIADLAAITPGVNESQMRMYYSTFVDSINMLRTMMRDLANTPYLSSGQREMMNAAARFYDAYETIGLLSLS